MRCDRAAARAEQRAHPARSEASADRRVRHRPRGPRCHVDLPVHRHDTAGGELSRGTRPARRRRCACALPGGWSGPQPRGAGCGEPGMEAGAGGQRHLRGNPARTPTTPSATRSLPARSSTRWLRPCSNAATSAWRPWSTSCQSWRAWTSRADGSPGSSPGWTSATSSARAIRCSDAGYPIWTS